MELDLETKLMNYLQQRKTWQSQERIRKDLNVGTESALLVALHNLRKNEMVEARQAGGKTEWRMKR